MEHASAERGSSQDEPRQDDTPHEAAAAAEELTAEHMGTGGGLRHIAVDRVSPNPHQPRQKFDEAGLDALAASIKADGMMQPVVVRPPSKTTTDSQPMDGDVGFELVAGERRWRAAQRAGLEMIPALVRELDDRQVAEWALIENLQREDLNPMDRAEAFAGLSEQFVLSHDQIAQRVGVNRSSVSNLMRLLELCDPVRQLIRDNLLSMGQGRALASIADPGPQAQIAHQAVKKGLSVRQVETAVRSALQAAGHDPSSDSPKPSEHRPAKTAAMADMEKILGEQLGTRVQIRRGKKKGSGTLTIDFYDLDQFEDLIRRMGATIE